MSRNTALIRKVVYVVGIVVLLIPLFYIGQPASRTAEGGTNPGGKLAQLRTAHNLSQADLGEIDPAGESLKLATLGMRGVAANLLWKKANDYKMKEDWDNLSATLKQITKLQPNFISVWEFQSHNLSYNVSVEFDDYRQRYHWVKKGISFLMEGTHLNRDNPALLHWIGWYLGQKVGRADEHVQFRELFRRDDDFHQEMNANGVSVDEGVGYDGRPDNWLVGRQWYLWGQRAVDSKGMPLKSKSPLIYHANPPMSLINYASDIEDEGILGEVAQRAWADGGKSWAEYGRRLIPTSFGHNVRLGDIRQISDEIERLRKSLAELSGNIREQILQERTAKLTPDEQAALKLQETEIDEANYRAYSAAKTKTAITHQEVAQRSPPEVRDKALTLAAKLVEQETLFQRTASYRSIINYEYWELRCQAEQTRPTVAAREFLYKAGKAHDNADPETARKMYEQAWRQWRVVFDEHPKLMDDIGAEDIVTAIDRYQRSLQQLDEEMPDDFPLRDFLQRRGKDLSKYFKKKSSDQPAEKPAAEKPAAKEPAAKEPAAKEPAAKEPAAKEESAGKPD